MSESHGWVKRVQDEKPLAFVDQIDNNAPTFHFLFDDGTQTIVDDEGYWLSLLAQEPANS